MVVGLNKIEHFEFFNSGEVHVRESCSGDRQVIRLLKDTDKPDGSRPPIVRPKGLSQQRMETLYSEIRPFVTEDHQDVVCQLPPFFDSFGA